MDVSPAAHCVAVFGSRGWGDASAVRSVLDEIAGRHNDLAVVCADGRWVDHHAQEWATDRKVTVVRFHTDFSDGMKAARRRDDAMIDWVQDRVIGGGSAEVIIFDLLLVESETDRLRNAAKVASVPGRVIHGRVTGE